MKIYIVAIFTTCCHLLCAQYEWVNHTGPNLVYQIAIEDNYAWLADRGVLLKVDLETGLQTKYLPDNSALASFGARSIAIDSSGVKWIGTSYGGLYSYDDKVWTHIETSVANNVTRLTENIQVASNGDVWFIEAKGNYELCRYDGEVVSYYGNYFAEDVEDYVLKDSSSMYVMTDNIVYEFDGIVAREIIAKSEIVDGDVSRAYLSDLEIGANNELLLLSTQKHDGLNDKHEVVVTSFDDSDLDRVFQDSVIHNGLFAKTDDGKVWFQISYNNHRDLDSMIYLNYDGDQILKETINTTGLVETEGSSQLLHVDAEGTKSIISYQDDEMYLHRTLENEVQKSILLGPNVGIGSVDDIVEDCEGNIWTVDKNRISKFDGVEWTHIFDVDIGLRETTSQENGFVEIELNPVTCELWIMRYLWFTREIVVYDGTQFQAYENNTIGRHLVFDKEGQAYSSGGTDGIIKFLSPSEVEIVPLFNASGDELICDEITIDTSGGLWFGTYGGIAYYNDGVLEHFSSDVLPIREQNWSWYSIYVDPNNHVWTESERGLVRYDGADWEVFVMEYDEINIWDIFGVIDGNLFIDTRIVNRGEYGENVIVVFDGYEFKEWTIFNKPINYYTNGLIETSNSDLWIRHSRGLTQLQSISDQSAPRVAGKVFYDSDRNGTFDASIDQKIPDQRIVSSYGNQTFSNSAGGYSLIFENEGDYSISILPQQDWEVTTEPSYDISINEDDLLGLDFGLWAEEIPRVLKTDLTVGNSICNETMNVWVHVQNSGLENRSGQVHLFYDSLFRKADVSPAVIDSSETSVIWNFDNLSYTEQNRFNLVLNVPSEDFLGNYFQYTAQIISEGDTILHIDSLELLCAYDPNDKLVRATGVNLADSISLIKDPLEYTIRFQNLGNYPARKVVIIDSLESQLDPSSFEFISSSHEVIIYIDKDGVVRFTFEDINLVAEETDRVKSNGFVKFRINARIEIPTNSIIENEAHIYFDYNAGIRTNKTSNKLVDNLSSSESTTRNYPQQIDIYPNPSSGRLWIDLNKKPTSTASLNIISASGELISHRKLEERMNLVNLDQQGMYFLIIETEDSTVTRKIVITN